MKDQIERGMMEVFAESLITGDSGQAIMNQEARGQQALVNSDVLPRDGSDNFEAVGIEILSEADDLFYNVRLPAGWKKQSTNHSMHSDLLDDKGRRRAGIFYKAAFYDRNARIGFNRRYNYGVVPEGGWANYDRDANTPFVGQVTDCGSIIWQSEKIAQRTDYPAQDVLEKEAKAWLAEHFPMWNDVNAYWD